MKARAVLAVLAAACGASGASCTKGDSAPHARTCVIAPPTQTSTSLRTDGTRLRDSLGRVVFLRGVNAGGRSKFAPFAPFDFASPEAYAGALAAYMDRAASWGIDAMRVPFTWAAVEPTPGKDDEDFLKRYDALLDAAWARGIWTIVDFHQDVYAEAFCGDGFPPWTIPDPKPAPHHDCASWQLGYFNNADVKAAFDRLWADGSTVRAGLVAMWDRMLLRHKDRPGVVGFEIINEPGPGTQAGEVFEATTLFAFFREMVPRFRAAAPNALVFIDLPGINSFTLATTLPRPPGDGIVFAPHYYPLGANPEAVLGGMQKWADVGAQWNVPTFVGEFGASNARDTTKDYMSAHFAAFDALGMSGTQWEYSVASEDWNFEAFGVVGADGVENPVAAAVIRPFARAVAGSDITTSFDAASRAFALSYVPGAGGRVTEVSLPTRAYAAGFDVALTGGCVDTSQPNRLLIQADDGATKIDLKVTSR